MKLYAILPIFLCLLTMTGCDSQPDQEEIPSFPVFKDLPLPDVFAEIPENYQAVSSGTYQKYYTYEDASIIFTEDTSKTNYYSAYEYSIQALKSYQELTDTVDFIENEKLFSSDGYAIETLEFQYSLDHENTITALTGYFTDGKVMYIITCKSNADTYQNHKEEFIQVMHSASIVRH